MLERKDSENNVQCVEKNIPEWPDTSKKNTRILLPGPSKEQWRPTPIISLKLWTLFTKALAHDKRSLFFIFKSLNKKTFWGLVSNKSVTIYM